MALTNISFYIFLPICIAIYFFLDQRFRYVWLLFCSYYFYSTLDNAFTSLLIISTIITWVFGLLTDISVKKAAKSAFLITGTILNLSILFVFKYADFVMSFFDTTNRLNLILPAGISFYTFQSLTYLFDIYNGKIHYEKNIFKYALFVSFFPLILSGPIERASHLIPQLICDKEFDAPRAKDGLKLMLFGYFLKIVIVSRMTILTDYVFTDYLNKSGVAVMIAVLCYSVQIYCDFSGYSLIAAGMCKIMGIEIIKNFNQPYFAVSVADFWRRWHISLSSWFKDYVYIPLGGNRKGRLRKYLNTMIVFVISGLWHGANITFVLWGFLNGIYQIIGDLLHIVKEKFFSFPSPDKNSRLYRIPRTVITFILISFTWVFFRADTVFTALDIIRKMFTSFRFVNLFDGTLFTLGLGVKNMIFALVSIAILILADVLCEKKKCDVSGLLVHVKTPLRYAVYYMLIIMIILSMNLNMTEFIYSGF